FRSLARLTSADGTSPTATGPQQRIEFFFRPDFEFVRCRSRAEDRKHGRAGTGQERGRDLGLSAQPALHLREEKMLFENRALEIVHKQEPTESLRCIIDAGERARILPLPIGPRRRHAEFRFEQEQLESRRFSQRLDDLPSPAATGRGLPEKKWNIGANLCRD